MPLKSIFICLLLSLRESINGLQNAKIKIKTKPPKKKQLNQWRVHTGRYTVEKGTSSPHVRSKIPISETERHMICRELTLVCLWFLFFFSSFSFFFHLVVFLRISRHVIVCLITVCWLIKHQKSILNLNLNAGSIFISSLSLYYGHKWA